jgi:dihydroxyacetone kinase-like protein
MKLETNICRDMMIFVSDGIIKDVDILTEADKMGDADHGTGMENGFNKVKQKLMGVEFDDLEQLFKTCGMAIMMSSGGASGAIFGTLFREGSKAFKDKTVLESEDFAAFLDLGLKKVMERGGASPGDKTMIDAVESANSNNEKPFPQFIRLVYEAALKGSENTKNMVAAFGRMKTLGERTIGHPDPGSITMSLILKYMGDFVEGALK